MVRRTGWKGAARCGVRREASAPRRLGANPGRVDDSPARSVSPLGDRRSLELVGAGQSGVDASLCHRTPCWRDASPPRARGRSRYRNPAPSPIVAVVRSAELPRGGGKGWVAVPPGPIFPVGGVHRRQCRSAGSGQSWPFPCLAVIDARCHGADGERSRSTSISSLCPAP